MCICPLKTRTDADKKRVEVPCLKTWQSFRTHASNEMKDSRSHYNYV